MLFAFGWGYQNDNGYNKTDDASLTEIIFQYLHMWMGSLHTLMRAVHLAGCAALEVESPANKHTASRLVYLLCLSL